MTRTRFSRRVVLAAGLIVAILAVTAAVAAVAPESVAPYPAGGQTLYGVRPTAIGLPLIGESGTVGANALAGPLRAYHDSGAYGRDLGSVDRAAQAYIAQRLAARTKTRRCTVSYQPVPHIPGHGTLYRRVRHCVSVTAPLRGTPALVLDIDETSLSNYADLAARGFDASGVTISAVGGHGIAIGPTLALYRYAKAHRVAVFFVTGRPSAIESITTANLRHAGFDRGWTALYEKPVTAGTERFKSSTRAAIQRRGYDIIANVGDQQSDLDGGHADRDFKLPDPFYFISD